MKNSKKFRKILEAAAALGAFVFAATACVSTEKSRGNDPAKVAPEGEYFAPGKIVRVVPEDGISAYKIFTENEILLRVEFFGSDCFRLQAAKNGEFDDPENDPKKAQILLETLPVNRSLVKVAQSPEKILFETDALKLELDRAKSTFALFKKDGALVWKEARPLAFVGEKTVQMLATDDDEFFYGGGQQNGAFSHKGTIIEIVADGNWNEGGHPNPAPFYVSNKGYGVLRHTFSPGIYDFSGTTEIATAHNEDRFDAFYFVGGSFPRTLELYTKFTGTPNFIPRWGLGLGDADAYMTRDKKTKEPSVDEDGNFVETTPDAIEVAKKYRENEMPADWLLVNDGYGCGYVQLPYVVDELAKLGFHTGLWTEGALTKTKFEVGTAGTRIQKLDVAWTGPAYQHGLECNKSAFDSFIENSNARPFIWTVQGWAGTQRYGICWTGDQSGNWDLIRYHIPTLITSGMSAQAYATTDVDGIFGGSPETFTRDLQWKCFTPAIYAMNGWAKISKSPWSYEEPYRSINRKFLRLKSALKPYVYKFAHDAAVAGTPIVRGMIWNFPNDRKTWDDSTKYQFMLGNDILVAPVFVSMAANRGWRKEKIYLPEGIWLDYWDGRRIEGPTTIDAYPISLEKIPVFIRGGAIIPMYPEHDFDGEKPFDPLSFDIYPSGKSEFELYEDDGSSRDWEKGKFATKKIYVDAPENAPGNIKIVLEPTIGDYDGKIEKRNFRFEIHVPVEPDFVKINGNAVAFWEGDESKTSFFYDKEKNGVIKINVCDFDESEKIEIEIGIAENNAFPKSEPIPVPEKTNDLDKSEFAVSQDAAPLSDEIFELGNKKIAPEKIRGNAKFNQGILNEKIVVDGNDFKNSIAATAGTEIVYKLDGSFDKLKGHVGREKKSRGNVTFRVFADGKQIFERFGQKPNDVKQLLDVEISGGKEIRLVVVPEGDASDNATVVWCDFSFVKKGSE